MENGIFGRLSVEEHSTIKVEDNVIADIAAEEAYVEAVMIGNEIAGDAASMKQAETAIVSLEEQVATIDKALETPESVASSSVIIAQESLAGTAAMLGAKISHTVSQEAAVSNPVSALTVSQEGVKDFLKKVVESIKAIFRKIMNAAKKLFVKISVAMDGTVNTAKKLEKRLGKITNQTAKTANLKEVDVKKMAGTVGASMALNSTSADYGKFAASTVLDGAEATGEVLVGIVNAIETISKDVLKVSVKDDADAATKKFASEYNKLFANAAKAAKFKAFDVKGLEDRFGYETPSDAETGTLVVIPAIVKGTSLKIVEGYVKDKGGDYSLKVKTLSVDKDWLNTEDVKIPVPTFKDIETLVGNIVTHAPKVSKFSGDRMKEINELDKGLDQLAKDSDGPYWLNKLKAGDATKRRDVATGLLLDSVLAYAASLKGTLSLASAYTGYYGSSDM